VNKSVLGIAKRGDSPRYHRHRPQPSHQSKLESTSSPYSHRAPGPTRSVRLTSLSLKNRCTGSPDVRVTILLEAASLELVHEGFECENVALKVGVGTEVHEYAEGGVRSADRAPMSDAA
jgi:hypothetical protein